MAHLTDEELQRLLAELNERFPEAVERAARLREHARTLDPLPVTLQVGTEEAADDEVYLAQARLDDVIAGYGAGRYGNHEVNVARKQMAVAYARRSLAAARAAFEREGVRWEDVPADDDWSDVLYA